MVRNQGNGSWWRAKKRYSLFCGIVLNFLLIAFAPGISRAATPQISAGFAHSVELKSDGTVWAWGDNSGYQLGLGSSFTATYSSVAEQVTGISGIIAVAAGENHTLALKSDGTVWAWGTNDHGQLGNSDLTSSASYSNVPIEVSIPSNETIKAIAAGTDFSLALDSNGAVWAWGRNDSGQLGSSTLNLNDQFKPVNISAITSVITLPVITQIAAGQYHALAVDATGLVWAWGGNSNGQLGDGTVNGIPIDSEDPVKVTGLSGAGNLSGVTKVAAGDLNSFALMSGGTVTAWGLNATGQLGNGSKTDANVPVSVSTITGVTAISAGYSQTIALKSDGTVWAWGGDVSGELGNGTTTASTTPQPNGFTAATSCSAGNFFSLALKSDGTSWAWGDNSDGQLGNAAFEPLPSFGTPSSTPTVVIPMGDMNESGTVTAADALLALRVAVGLDSLTALDLLVGDMNGDGKITAADALLILREAVGL
jgi:alpha-tubulin suppressor-like RCC1 family protein